MSVEEINKINKDLQNVNDEDEVDLIALVKILLEKRKVIIKFTLVSFLIGFFVAVFTPEEYTASTVFISQGSGKGSGSLGGLAALAGVSVQDGGDSKIPLGLYEDILNSVPFQKELIKTLVTVKERDHKITYEEYFNEVFSPGVLASVKKYTIGLPNLVFNKIKNKIKNKKEEKALHLLSDSIIYTSKREVRLFNTLKNRINLEVNEENNTITISVNMPEPILAAEITYATQSLLEQYVIDFKIKKSKSKLNFIKKRYKEKEKILKTKQYQLANFKDRNKYVVSAKSQTRLTTLKAEFNLAYNVFNDLAKQLESQKIQVTEDTPVFSIIHPVLVPLDKSAPKRLFIVFVYLFLGFVLAITIVFGMNFYNELKKKINKID